MNIAASKQLRRDLCRTVGHVWGTFSRSFPGYSEGGNICSRCKKRDNVWGMGTPEFIGKMLPRVDVEVIPLDGMDDGSTYKILWEE